MASAGYGLLFSNLQKFNRTNGDLSSWLRQFNRSSQQGRCCCVVANKVDELVKGQLLMIFVAGQAKAILKEFEEQAGRAQTYDELSKLLKKH